ncbi:MAG: fluoride efflux transporter FluC [Microbacterium gubbeenense]
MTTMISAILVGVGGALGTIVRFLLSAVTPNVAGIPLGTLLINLSGALALGWLLSALAAHGTESGRRAQLRLFFGTGVLGGYTTYSALAVDSFEAIASGSVAAGIVYAAASVVLGVACAAFGILLGRRWPVIRRARR